MRLQLLVPVLFAALTVPAVRGQDAAARQAGAMATPVEPFKVAGTGSTGQ